MKTTGVTTKDLLGHLKLRREGIRSDLKIALWQRELLDQRINKLVEKEHEISDQVAHLQFRLGEPVD